VTLNVALRINIGEIVTDFALVKGHFLHLDLDYSEQNQDTNAATRMKTDPDK
jgi:hypothetical protein